MATILPYDYLPPGIQPGSFDEQNWRRYGILPGGVRGEVPVFATPPNAKPAGALPQTKPPVPVPSPKPASTQSVPQTKPPVPVLQSASLPAGIQPGSFDEQNWRRYGVMPGGAKDPNWNPQGQPKPTGVVPQTKPPVNYGQGGALANIPSGVSAVAPRATGPSTINSGRLGLMTGGQALPPGIQPGSFEEQAWRRYGITPQQSSAGPLSDSQYQNTAPSTLPGTMYQPGGYIDSAPSTLPGTMYQPWISQVQPKPTGGAAPQTKPPVQVSTPKATGQYNPKPGELELVTGNQQMPANIKPGSFEAQAWQRYGVMPDGSKDPNWPPQTKPPATGQTSRSGTLPASNYDDQIKAFVNQNINNPQMIAQTASQYGVKPADIARATGYSPGQIAAYFKNAGIGSDWKPLQENREPQKVTDVKPTESFEGYLTRLGFKEQEGGGWYSPDPEVNGIYPGSPQYENLQKAYDQSALFYGSNGATSDPVISGQQFRNIGNFANNDPDPVKALQIEIDHLRENGLNPVNHPVFGWIVPDNEKFHQAHPAQEETGFDKVLGFVLPTLIGMGMGAGIGAGISGFISSMGGAGTAGAGASAAEFATADAVQMAGQGLSESQIAQTLQFSGMSSETAAQAASMASQGMSAEAIQQALQTQFPGFEYNPLGSEANYFSGSNTPTNAWAVSPDGNEFLGQPPGDQGFPPDITSPGNEITDFPPGDGGFPPDITSPGNEITDFPPGGEGLPPDITSPGNEIIEAPGGVEGLPPDITSPGNEITDFPPDSGFPPDITSPGNEITDFPPGGEGIPPGGFPPDITSPGNEITDFPPGGAGGALPGAGALDWLRNLSPADLARLGLTGAAVTALLGGGGGNNTTTSSVTYPEWYNQGSRNALALADQYAARGEDVVAPLSSNEILASNAARDLSGAWIPTLARANTTLDDARTSFDKAGALADSVPGYLDRAAGQVDASMPYFNEAGKMAKSVPGYLDRASKQVDASMPYFDRAGALADSVPGYLDRAAGQVDASMPYFNDAGTMARSVPGYLDRATSQVDASMPYFDKAGQMADTVSGYLGRAGELTNESAGGIPSIDLSTYMNPYLDNVLTPIARRNELAKAQALNDINAKAGMRGAFGGSRSTLLESQTAEAADRNMNEAEANIRSGAFTTGLNTAQADLNRKLAAGGQFGTLGATAGNTANVYGGIGKGVADTANQFSNMGTIAGNTAGVLSNIGKGVADTSSRFTDMGNTAIGASNANTSIGKSIADTSGRFTDMGTVAGNTAGTLGNIGRGIADTSGRFTDMSTAATGASNAATNIGRSLTDAAGGYRANAAAGGALYSQDINNLMSTGGLSRGVEQARRDAPLKAIGGYSNALRGAPSTTTTVLPESSRVGEVTGALTALLGANKAGWI